MKGGSEFLLSVSDLVAVHGQLQSSIDTIWSIYVFVLLGMVGWIVVRQLEYINLPDLRRIWLRIQGARRANSELFNRRVTQKTES